MRTTSDSDLLPPTITVEAPRFYSVSQVAQMLGMSTMTLYRAISAGEFPAVRIRGRLIVRQPRRSR
ncbi:MAG: helix-turn-helix domain-containing protein [Actinobacteria bacterium]|nr:helix-turn-helix domain-containing protein [Actinomycetota bacterium]